MEVQLQGVCSKDVTRKDQLLFSESPSRFLVEVRPEDFGRMARLCESIPFGEVGRVTGDHISMHATIRITCRFPMEQSCNAVVLPS